MVFFGEHLLKGFLAGGGSGGFFIIENRIYLKMQIGSSQRQIYRAISHSPWSLKPIFGMLSDLLVMWKFRRTQWIIITAVLAFVSYVLVVAFKTSLPAMIICICFFFGRMQCSWTDLMIESCYSEKMKDVPDRASDIVTWVWVGIGIGGLFATLVVSPCLDNLGPFTSTAIPLAIAGLPIIPAALGWLTEVKCSTPSCGFRWEALKQKKRYFACALLLSVCVLTNVACGIARVSRMYQAIVAIIVSVVTFIGCVILLPHQLWGPMGYMFLSNALSLATEGFIDNFYLDAATPQESEATGYPICADCPHFDNYFYTTIVGVWDSLFTVLGSWLFNFWMADWTYRKALVVTQILVVVTSLFDIIQFQRWNKSIGIPDWVFMLGKAAFQNTMGMLNFMPTTILIAKLCPVGAESTVFALLAGYSNFGSSIASYLGAYVQDWLGLGNIGSGEVDDFSNAWIASVINAFCPLVVLLFIPFLIPDARMTDSLVRIGAEEEEGTKKLPSDDEDPELMIDLDDTLSSFPGPAPTPSGANSDGEATHIPQENKDDESEKEEEDEGHVIY
eukprot:EG_transcript_4298